MKNTAHGPSSPTTVEAPPHSSGTIDNDPSLLTIVHSPDAEAIGRTLLLSGEMAVVGRDISSQGLSISDAQLSRTHFRVAHDGRANGDRLGDAGSRNGTYVNGWRVESVTLQHGAVVRAGETVFVYLTHDPMKNFLAHLSPVATSGFPVLLRGETGTGKERFARSIHEMSGRTGNFVALNCAALPRELLITELFGHMRGAFSGATGSRLGLFQAASGGTLFLDEIGDFPEESQGVLLRTLQESTVRPVGSDLDVPVDVRIVSATHKDLDTAMADNSFRTDLYARLAHVVLHVPPLRERRDAIIRLARDVARSSGEQRLEIEADAAEALVRYTWPLNVRELQTIARGFIALERNRTVLDLRYLQEHHPAVVEGFRRAARSGSNCETPAPVSVGRDRAALEKLLSRHGGNVSAAAEELKKPRAQVYRWLKELGLDPARFRTRRA